MGHDRSWCGIARPFTWKFTRADLDDLLHRIDTHQKTQLQGLAA
ncbi:MAG TPA: hypothetical protein VEH31_36565 [Streptosporangiaceae bacterium]|nr:hypothetical protein [Streptosporangiaceae bacterium]HYA51996.1 hypothetical protein [Streptosporangiaceae bacterium]